MNYQILLHPDVTGYLDSLEDGERRRCYNSLKKLGENPLLPRSGSDIKQLRGKRKIAYRLRVGDHRFLYVIKDRNVFVEEAFRRKKGYGR
jgi:mRNA-degrading endonuclease RelE of RelBE toxin-antitoxin system